MMRTIETRTPFGHRLRRQSAALLVCGCLVVASGCTSFSKSTPEIANAGESGDKATSQGSISDRANAASEAARVSNPPAKQIRFDGQEQLLGGGTCRALPPGELSKQLRELVDQSKLRSAVTLVRLNGRSARRLLFEQPAELDPELSELIALTLDQASNNSEWQDLAIAFESKSSETSDWRTALAAIQAKAGTKDVEAEIAKLNQIATSFDRPSLQIEAQRVKSQQEVARGETQTAIETLVSAAELAAQTRLPAVASDLWLMTCDASLRLELVDQARQCWRAAVSSQLQSMHARGAGQALPSIDPVFWEHAVRLAHPGDALPKELTLTLAPWCSRVGVRVSDQLSPEAALWTAIAEYQLATGQAHVASVSVKRAEVEAPEEAHPYLQIMLARAMAAQGQQSVATTILGTLTESSDPNVQASSLATLGSIKMHSGAYEQGGNFLGQALSIHEAKNWPGRLAAQADMANMRLIVGRLDEALPELRAVQTEMMKANKWQSLCQSLANEAAILELEGRDRDAKLLHERIAKIESQI